MAFSENFLDVFKISRPILSKEILDQFEEQEIDFETFYLDYKNFSVHQNPFRKFPYYTAANIDGNLFRKISRRDVFDGGSDSWKTDERIGKQFQLGHPLYKADRSDFDKGHLTKREDVQWGETDEDAKEAARSTFYFTNAMPQVDRLNRGVWRRIEDYILHQEVVDHKRKITLFTGPVFFESDPEFVTEVNDETIKLPYLFWKVIYYTNNGELHRTAFLTSQIGLLEKKRIVKPKVRGDEVLEKQPFQDFRDAETYQVNVSLIEEITNMRFQEAKEAFSDDRPQQLIMKEIIVRSENGSEGPQIQELNMQL